MAAIDGSILALKILVSTKIRDFLNNMDNKSIKNQRKEVSSSHPPRSLNKRNCHFVIADGAVASMIKKTKGSIPKFV